MRELAIKHREYIMKCQTFRTSTDGAVSTALRQAYIRETGEAIGHCGSCFINIVIPAYVRLIKEIDNENK